jgi:hypothetical protein
VFSLPQKHKTGILVVFSHAQNARTLRIAMISLPREHKPCILAVFFSAQIHKTLQVVV